MNLAKPLAMLYTGLETDLMKNIADFLLVQNLDSSTAKWKINKLAQLGALDKANIKTISEHAGVVPTMLANALEMSSLTAINELETGFKELVKDGILNATTVPIEDSMANAIKTYYNQAVDKYNLVNTVMKYKANSVAQKLIYGTAELAEKQDFLDILNKATGKAVTGIESRTSALSQCIKEMTDKGIPAFTDKLGREWSPEAYVNMDIRTTCSNVANKSQFDRMDDYGISLMEISSHSGARPKCAKYQGTIVDRSGKSTKYLSLKQTSYGEPDGLFGINCGHKPYPYIEGVSTQRYFPYDENENAEQYKKFQQQRQLERNVRTAKRECMAMDTLGDKDGFSKSSVKLKASQGKLKQYCTDNNLSYKADRTATPGYGKSISSKVT